MGNTAVVERRTEPPADLIRIAVENKTDLAALEKVLELQERFEANEARKVYNKNLAAVHAKIPTVAKKLTNSQTHSKYASLDTIIEKTREVYTALGFSVSFYEGDTPREGHVRVCADLRHEAGHSTTYFYDVPLDGVGIKGNANMTAIHGKASSVSYGRRYLMCMIFNIPTGDDNDGNAVVGFISSKQVDEIKSLLKEYGVDEALFLAYAGVESIDRLPLTAFSKSVAAIKAKKKK